MTADVERGNAPSSCSGGATPSTAGSESEVAPPTSDHSTLNCCDRTRFSVASLLTLHGWTITEDGIWLGRKRSDRPRGRPEPIPVAKIKAEKYFPSLMGGKTVHLGFEWADGRWQGGTSHINGMASLHLFDRLGDMASIVRDDMAGFRPLVAS